MPLADRHLHLDSRRLNRGDSFHSVTEHIGEKSVEQILVGMQSHVYRDCIAYNIIRETLSGQEYRKRLAYIRHKFLYVDCFCVWFRQMRQFIVGFKKTTYSLALAGNQRDCLDKVFALISLRILLHVGTERYNRSDGIPHLMRHYAQDSVIVQLARLQFETAGIIQCRYTPHCLRHAIDVGIMTAGNPDCGVVHLQRINKSRHGEYQPPDKPA